MMGDLTLYWEKGLCFVLNLHPSVDRDVKPLAYSLDVPSVDLNVRSHFSVLPLLTKSAT